MPMLHGCAFPGCTTLTLSAYCVEHELLVRAAKESERAHDPERLSEPVPGARADSDALVESPGSTAF